MLSLILTVEYSWSLVVPTLNLLQLTVFVQFHLHTPVVHTLRQRMGFLGIVTKGVYGNVANLLSSFRHRGTRIASSCQTIPSSLLSVGSATLHPILELPSPFCINIFASTKGQASKCIILNFCTFLQLVPFL